MSANMLKQLTKQILPDLSIAISKFLGIDENKVGKAMEDLFPVFMVELLNQTQNSNSWNRLYDESKMNDFAMENDVYKLFSGGGYSLIRLLKSGKSCLSLIPHSAQNHLVTYFASRLNLKPEQCVNLIQLGVPFLFKYLNASIVKNEFDIHNFKSYLIEQGDHILDMAPTTYIIQEVEPKPQVEFEIQTEISTPEKNEKEVIDENNFPTTTIITEPVEAEEGSLFKWLMGSIVVLGLLCFFGIKTYNSVVGIDGMFPDPTRSTTVVPADHEIKDNVANESSTISHTDKFKLSFEVSNSGDQVAIDTINFEAGTIGNQIMGFKKSGFSMEPTFSFKNLNFKDQSYIITENSNHEILDLAKIMQAYPALKINIQGFSNQMDNLNDNVNLSRARADAVKAALLENRIAGRRIFTNAQTSSKLISGKDSASKMEENRIEVTIR